ncbi:MAG: hypothetical protein JSR65_07840 [Proteobacteria bacterium]|nr:hypothetical protein [Pseudomonadota bacterium]
MKWVMALFSLGVVVASSTLAQSPPTTSTRNPCGLFSLKANAGPPTPGHGEQAHPFTQEVRLALATRLGAGYVRINTRLNGRIPYDELQAARRAGLGVVLHVTTHEGGASAGPVTDLAAYRASLSNVLDHFHPDVLAIENEEVDPSFYSGTADQYLAQLQVAIDVAHAHGVKVTNGGLTNRALSMVLPGVAANEEDGAHRGGGARHPDNARAQRKAAMTEQLLSAYGHIGLDYVNFHWYRRDPEELEHVVKLLRERTGKPIISTELGEYDDSASWPAGVLGASRRVGLPIAIWFNGDGHRAVALANADGSLRPNAAGFESACH